MKVQFGAVVAAVLLASCATNEGGFTKSSDVEARLVGMPELELAQKLGAPTEQANLSDGTTIWTYRSNDDFLNGGKCTVSVTIKDHSVASAKVLAQDRSWVSFPLGSCASIIGKLDRAK
jgi:major membrane immunogen (membrane-anchored lipoprotein)